MSDPNTPGETPAGDPQPHNPYGPPPGAPDPYGQPPAGHQDPYGQAGYGQPHAQPTGYGVPSAGDPDQRPGTVTAAGIVTVVFSGLSLLFFVLVLVALVVAQDEVLAEIEGTEGFENAGISANDLLGVAVGVMGLFALWCLLALVLGVLVLRRSNAARITLVVSAVLSALLSLLAIGSGVSALTLIASVATIVLLFTGGAGDWFARRGAVPPPPGMTRY